MKFDSGYAPQVGCEVEKKEEFWKDLDQGWQPVPCGPYKLDIFLEMKNLSVQ